MSASTTLSRRRASAPAPSRGAGSGPSRPSRRTDAAKRRDLPHGFVVALTRQKTGGWRMKARAALALLCSACLWPAAAGAADLKINEKGYFARQGLNVMVFSDYYPEGHQTGVTIVQHGTRVAANGDLRLEASPGQWSPTPAVGQRIVDAKTGSISETLSYPDPKLNGHGFNPIFYPKL